MATAIALLRVSTPDQRLGLAAQRTDIDRYAAAHGIEVVEWVEEVVSGGAPFEARLGLQAACESIARLGASHLLVSKRDRFARDPLVALLTERSLEQIKATVLCADGNNEQDPASELVRHILDGVARFERRMIGIRTKAALAAIVASGRKIGRPPGSRDLRPRKPRGPRVEVRS
jgi:DNA invertase Pin-like site-specific DNA recombinase